jgi:hypothetical protein
VWLPAGSQELREDKSYLEKFSHTDGRLEEDQF